MKDQAHHLKHLQKKVYRSAKRQQERVKKPESFDSNVNEVKPEDNHPQKTSDQLCPRILQRGHRVH